MTCRPCMAAASKPRARSSLVVNVVLSVACLARGSFADRGRHQFGAAAVEEAAASAAARRAPAAHDEASGHSSISVSGHGGVHRHRHHHRHHHAEAVHQAAEEAEAEGSSSGASNSIAKFFEAAVATGENATALVDLLEQGKEGATAVVSDVAKAIDELVTSTEEEAEQGVDRHRRHRHHHHERHHRHRDEDEEETETRREPVEKPPVLAESATAGSSLAESRSDAAEHADRHGAMIGGLPLTGLDDETPIIIDMSPIDSSPLIEPYYGGDYDYEDTVAGEHRGHMIERAQEKSLQARVAAFCGVDAEAFGTLVVLFIVFTTLAWLALMLACFVCMRRRDPKGFESDDDY